MNKFFNAIFRVQNETVDGAGEENEGFEQSFNSVVDSAEESSTKNKQVNKEKLRLVKSSLWISI